MTTDLQLAPPQQRFLPTPVESERVWKLAQTIAGTDFVPRGLRGNVAAITAAMLTGREIGIGPMHSLRAIDVIDGRPSLSAELMASLVLRSGHYLWCAESTAETCTMVGRRIDWPDRIPDQEVTWTIDDAKQAGLAGKGNWQKYPRAMLRARATSELCRGVFADVVERVGYVAEELGGDPQPHDQAVEVVRDVVPDQADTVDELLDDTDDDVVDAEVVEPDPPPTQHPDGWDVPPKDDDPATEVPFDWKAYAKNAGLNVVKVLTALRSDWPANDQLRKPKNSASIDELIAEDPTMAGYIRATIDDLAGDR